MGQNRDPAYFLRLFHRATSRHGLPVKLPINPENRVVLTDENGIRQPTLTMAEAYDVLFPMGYSPIYGEASHKKYWLFGPRIITARWWMVHSGRG